MRTILPIGQAQFAKEGEAFAPVALPHTWNAQDGQDGGADYWRGVGHYRMALPAPTPGKCQYIQFEGANHVAAVRCNGRALGTHKGGFSTFRFALTDVLQPADNLLEVDVDNRECDVYPQQADFTFFGGLYRAVRFIEVERAHFTLEKAGTSGVFVTPRASGSVRVDAFAEGAEGCTIRCELRDAAGAPAAQAQAEACAHTVFELNVEAPHLWNGLDDPYCYTAVLTILRGDQAEDSVAETFGFRSFHVDPERGFFLNGKSYPLHGVSRHQDRLDKGWAIGAAEHEEDLALIREVGANTIRLAHYQHDAYFYSLCDAAGMVLWAEIPFISVFREGKEAHDDTIRQMTELVAQNYNHPSICFWGISNEITIGGESEALYQNLCELNALVKKLDPSRLTTMAEVSMVPMDSPHVYITDVLSYNHYFGWYGGVTEDNGPWLDAFRRKNPDRALGVSEYGAEGVLKWHSARPENHDYTEEYQAQYHQKMLETFAARPYLWSTHVWNMFDFAADARDEGGCTGRNNKGLVTYDRKTRKDAFFVYKAWWTQAPMVHVCGARFADRAPGQRDVTVVTNGELVTLLVNGAEAGTRRAENHVAVFPEVALAEGKNTITARTAGAEDTIALNGVAQPNPAYVLPEEPQAAGNWFDGVGEAGALEFPEGYFSIRDKLGDILANEDGKAALEGLFTQLGGKSMVSMLGMLRSMPVEQILKMAGKKAPAGAAAYLNGILNKIKK
jgi:beta-galactosidase